MTMIKLHVGSGSSPIEGWVNIDNHPYPGVDRVLDVREGLPYQEVDCIFCEHFLEHLTLGEGLAFLHECRRVLSRDGIIRISTPNLDWVWLTHYRNPADLTQSEAVSGCLEINRAFHGWGHRFLYNEALLNAALQSCGFATQKRFQFGESDSSTLRDLERHERCPDHVAAEHILIVEGCGLSTTATSFADQIDPYLRDEAIR